MGVLSKLIVKIAGDTKPLDRDLQRAKRSVKSFGADMQSAGLALTAGLTLPIIGIGAAALGAAGKMEQAEIAFSTLLKSGERGRKMLQDLEDFALKTPFEFEGLQNTAKRMLAFGFAAEKIIPTLRSVGDAVAAVGGGQVGIDRVTLALGQMSAKGTVQAQEMRQLAEANIKSWDILAAGLNTTVAGAMDMVTKKMVSSADAIPILLAGMNERFAGLMDKQSQTLFGKWSNVQDRLFKLFRELGEGPLMDVAGSLVDVMGDAADKAVEAAKWFKALPPVVQKSTLAFVALAAALPVLIVVLGTVTTNLVALLPVLAAVTAKLGAMSLALMGPGGVIALLAVGVVGALYAVQTSFVEMESVLDRVNRKALEDAVKLDQQMGSEADAAFALMGQYRDLATELQKYNVEIEAGLPINQELITTLQGMLAELRGVNAELPEAIRQWNAVVVAENAVADAAERLSQANLTEAIAGTAQATEDWFDAIEKIPKPLIEVGSKLEDINVDIADQIAILPPLAAEWKGVAQEVETLAETMDRLATESVQVGEDTVKSIDAQTKAWSTMERQVSTIMTDLGRGLADLIIDGGKFTDVLKQIGKSVLRWTIEAQFSRLIGLVGTLTGKLGSMGKLLGVIFGGGGSGAAGAVGGAVSSAGGAAGGVAGAVAGGALSATIGLVTGAISAVSGLIGNFQMHGMNKSLDLIVNHTLRTANQLIQGVQPQLNRYLPYLELMHNKFFGGGAESSMPNGLPINVIMLDGRVLTNALMSRATAEIRTTQGIRN